jgi:hypothetical protein
MAGLQNGKSAACSLPAALLRGSYAVFRPFRIATAFGEALSNGGYWLPKRLANGSRSVMDRSSGCPRHVR